MSAGGVLGLRASCACGLMRAWRVFAAQGCAPSRAGHVTCVAGMVFKSELKARKRILKKLEEVVKQEIESAVDRSLSDRIAGVLRQSLVEFPGNTPGSRTLDRE